jgi:hypothetical protein
VPQKIKQVIRLNRTMQRECILKRNNFILKKKTDNTAEEHLAEGLKILCISSAFKTN